jgi:hypothetical protein
METTLFEVKFNDGRLFKIFCSGKNQKKRFCQLADKLKNEIDSIKELSTGIHTISQFEIIINKA